jgi:UDP-glucose 4-epimerase
MPMKFLVTGGTGFIGSYLVRRLLREGQEVVCADCSSDPPSFPGAAPVIRCDVGNQEQVAAMFRAERPIDRVVHLAYIMGAESEADPPLAMRINALGTANIFDAACRSDVPRVIFLSSESVYGPQSAYGDRPVT